MRVKRKTWKDRTCHHGNKAEWRVTYDIIHCDEPGCWTEALRRLGLQMIPVDPADPNPCDCGEPVYRHRHAGGQPKEKKP